MLDTSCSESCISTESRPGPGPCPFCSQLWPRLLDMFKLLQFGTHHTETTTRHVQTRSTWTSPNKDPPTPGTGRKVDSWQFDRNALLLNRFSIFSHHMLVNINFSSHLIIISLVFLIMCKFSGYSGVFLGTFNNQFLIGIKGSNYLPQTNILLHLSGTISGTEDIYNWKQI